jgi:hypothetical protein
MPLTSDANFGVSGGDRDCAMRLQINETPYQGSAMAIALDGFLELIDVSSTGQNFGGIAQRRVMSKDHPAVGAADGDLSVPVIRGLFYAWLPISGVAQDDVAHQRAVFASDDGTFSFTPSGTLVGCVFDLQSPGIAIVACATSGHHGALGLRAKGVRTLAATGAQSLTTADLGKLILCSNTAGLTVSLPPAADCTGKGYVIKKPAGGAFAITIDPDGAETIDGAATFAAVDANNDVVEIISDGTAWHVIGGRIA